MVKLHGKYNVTRGIPYREGMGWDIIISPDTELV
jgi:hypothetical protein